MASNYVIRKVTIHDMAELSERMRAEDQAEVIASGSLNASAAVIESVEISTELKALEIRGELAAIFGVTRSQNSIAGTPIGIPWALTTDTAAKYPKIYVKVSKLVIAAMFKDYDILVNYVDNRYEAAIRWLRVLGFWVGEPEVYGTSGELFRPFVKKKVS